MLQRARMADRNPDFETRRRRVVLLLAFFTVVALLLFAFRAVLTPFLVAIFFAYMIDPVIGRMADLDLGKFRLGRGGAVVVVYVVLLTTLYIASLYAIPALGHQVGEAQRDLPVLAQWAEKQSQDIELWFKEWQEQRKQEREEAEARAEPDGSTPPGDEEAGGQEAVDGDASGATPPGPVAPKPRRVRLTLSGGGALEGEVVGRSDDEVVLRLGRRFQVVDRGRIDGERALDGEELELKSLLDRAVAAFVGHYETILRHTFNFAVGFVTGLLTVLYKIVLILMITAFLLIDREAIVRFFHGLPPESEREKYRRLSYYLDRGLAGVIRGQLAICAVNGVLTWIGLVLFGVRYSMLLGLIAGIFSLIPIFGTILSTIPIVLIAWGTGSIQTALLALGWILFIHFVEANFLNPKIMGTASKIHPVVVVFALIAGEHAYGLAGALLAVPTASLLQSWFKFYVIDKVPEDMESERLQASPS